MITIFFSSSEEDHVQDLTQIFLLCRLENIKLKISKCGFAQDKINFLGYEIQSVTITPADANIEVIEKLKPPSNKITAKIPRFN